MTGRLKKLERMTKNDLMGLCEGRYGKLRPVPKGCALHSLGINGEGGDQLTQVHLKKWPLN